MARRREEIWKQEYRPCEFDRFWTFIAGPETAEFNFHRLLMRAGGVKSSGHYKERAPSFKGALPYCEAKTASACSSSKLGNPSQPPDG